MPLFGNNYDTSLKPQQAKLNLSVDPYISQQMPFEHGIAAMPASPYGGGPSEEAQTVGAVGNAVTGVVDAYRQKKKMDAEKAYQDKLLAALGVGGATPASSSPVQAAPPQSMGIAEQDPEFARSLQAQSHQRYMNTLSAQPATSAGLPAPSATPATTATTPVGSSTFQINGTPMQPTSPAPAPAPASAPSSTPVPASSTAASLGVASPAGSPSVASGATSPIIQSLLSSGTAQGATNGMNLGSGGIVGNLLANLTGTQNKTGAGLALGSGLEMVANPGTLGMLTSIGA